MGMDDGATRRTRQGSIVSHLGGHAHIGEACPDDGRRDHVPRHHHDEGVSEEPRSKDIIISGGETISSLEVEVEVAICRHPSVLTVGVVAQPDPKWGESPCAFVELKPGATATEDEIIEHWRGLLARFKCPRRVVFGVLPKTSTGKIQKFVLRERVRSASAIE